MNGAGAIGRGDDVGDVRHGTRSTPCADKRKSLASTRRARLRRARLRRARLRRARLRRARLRRARLRRARLRRAR
ncbi:pentapeptide repeat-containing protein, partial [Mycobacterium sp.]|uniref:pentapeptide repeat-containing protein n=1 Tax=Mycobacterium sp. TaxID=1785 RepID=UPI00344CE411